MAHLFILLELLGFFIIFTWMFLMANQSDYVPRNTYFPPFCIEF